MIRRKHHSLRLSDYDYSQAGTYFVTVVVKNRQCLFGKVVEDEMHTNQLGKMLQKVWDDLASHYPEAKTDEFVVMPNHVHGIIILSSKTVAKTNVVGVVHEPLLRSDVIARRRMTIPKIIERFKTLAAKYINESRKTPGTPVWQCGYYDHVIRNDDDLNAVRHYIQTNPLRWHLDKEHPQVTR